jgi:hypothetical protein
VRSRVELFEAIRRDQRREELSIRQLADRHRVHRRTVRQALESAVPPSRKQRVFAAPVLGPVKPLIDAMLREDLDAPRKQRHTARRVLARLVDEHGVSEISYSTVRDYVAKRRPQILAEAGRALEAGCVPQTHEPAAEAEVDFHDLWVLLRGVKTKTALFTMRLVLGTGGASRFAVPGAGGVPGRSCLCFRPPRRCPDRQDPLRQPQARGVAGAVRPHSGRDATLGGVSFHIRLRRVLLPARARGQPREGPRGGRGRPVPPQPLRADAASGLDRRAQCAARTCDDADDARRVGNRATNVGQDWAIERPLLRPLPDEPFDTTLTLTPRVDRYAQVMVRCCQYSVPARFIGHRVRVKLSSTTVRVFDRDILVAEHERAVGKGVQVLELDHYLEILLRKPGAAAGRDRAGPDPRRRRVHRRARGVLGCRTQGARRPSRDAGR